MKSARYGIITRTGALYCVEVCESLFMLGYHWVKKITL